MKINKIINYNDLVDIMKHNKVLLVDVRSKQEFLEKHIDGAINIPLIDIKDNIGVYAHEFNQVIVLYCNAGIRSVKAQAILFNRGYKNVYVLDSMY